MPINQCAADAVYALTLSKCPWPIGEPRQAGFRFCGKPKEPIEPYCPVHKKRAYRKVFLRDLLEDACLVG